MDKISIKKFIKEIIQFMVIIVSIDLVWSVLEILFEGGITNTISDSVMGLALAYFINKEINEYKAHKLFMYNLKTLNDEMREIVGMEDKNGI